MFAGEEEPHEQCSLHQMVFNTALTVPNNTAIQYVNKDDQVCLLTYSQLVDHAKKIQREVRYSSGCRSIVGVMCTDQCMLPAWLIGVMSVPAAFLPLDNGIPALRLCYLVETLKIGVILTDTHNFQELMWTLGSDFLCHEEIPGQDLVLVKTKNAAVESSVHRGTPTPDDLAYVITTSGTTGQPKLVHVPHSCIVPNIQHLSEIYQLSPSDMVYQAAPLTFDPSIVEIFTTLSRGATLLMLPEMLRQTPQRLATALHKYGATVLQATPTLVSSMGGELLSQTLLGVGGLRVLALGGERCPRLTTLQSWKTPGNRTLFINLYGITEVSSWATYHVISQQDTGEIPLGRPLKDTQTELRPLVDDGSTCDRPNTVTELLIGGSRRQCHVYGGSEEVVMEMRHTGDIVQSDEHGVIRYVGRTDDQVKLQGKRVNLLEMERVCERCCAVVRAAAVVIQVGVRSGQICLFVQPWTKSQGDQSRNLGGGPTSSRVADLTEVVQRVLREHLPVHYWPRDVVTVESMPLTKHGKVDKKALLAAYRPSVPLPVHTSLQDAIIEQWQTVTRSATPPRLDSLFLESGGDSLGAVRLSDVIERLTGTEFPGLLQAVLEQPLQVVLQHVRTHGQQDNSTYTGLTRGQSNSTAESKGLGRSKLGLVEVSEDQEQNGSSGSEATTRKRKHEQVVENEAVDAESDSTVDSSYATGMDRSPATDDACVMSVSRSSRYTYHTPDGGETKAISERSPIRKPSTSHMILSQTWARYLHKCVDSSPLLCVLKSGRVLAVVGCHSYKRTLTAVDVATGEVQWSLPLHTRVEASPALSACGDHVLAGGYDGVMYVVDLHSGRTVWMFQAGGSIKTSPCVDPQTGLLYFGSHDHNFYCLDVQEQLCVWSADVGASVFSSPCVSQSPHRVYVGTLAGRLYCFNPKCGEPLWTSDLSLPIFSSPAVTPTGVCVASVTGLLHHLDHSGAMLWTYDTKSPVFSSPCIFTKQKPLSSQSTKSDMNEKATADERREASGCDVRDSSSDSSGIASLVSLSNEQLCEDHEDFTSITIGNQDGSVFCCTTKGQLLWKHRMPAKVYSSVFVFGDSVMTGRTLVAVCCSEGVLNILNQSTGELVSEARVGSAEVYSSPVVYRDCLVVGSRDNHLYCYWMK